MATGILGRERLYAMAIRNAEALGNAQAGLMTARCAIGATITMLPRSTAEQTKAALDEIKALLLASERESNAIQAGVLASEASGYAIELLSEPVGRGA